MLWVIIQLIVGISRYKHSVKGGYYHIYNRGNGKQDIFLDDQDYAVYINRLGHYRIKHGIALVCYCLMPNHIHLLVRQDTNNPIFKFISSIHTSYSMYFNKKYNHIGHLFQDRFKQSVVDSDEYLLHLSRYIHLNPVKDGLVKIPNDYRWSSYKEYIGASKYNFCQRGIILDYLSQCIRKKRSVTKSYNEFVYSYLRKGEDNLITDLTID